MFLFEKIWQKCYFFFVFRKMKNVLSLFKLKKTTVPLVQDNHVPGSLYTLDFSGLTSRERLNWV